MRKPVVWLSLLLLLLCGGWGWQAYQLWQIKRGSFIDQSSLTLRAAPERQTGMGLEAIVALHLFGNPAEKPAAPPAPAELPKTDLKLVLVGAMTDTDPAKASALIDTDKQVKRYYVGDSIAGGAVLHEVLPDSVVLKRENRYETLPFPKGGETAFTRSAETAKADMGVGIATGMGNRAASPPTAQQSAGAEPQPVLQENKPTGLSLRERLQKRPRTQQKPGQ